MEEKVALALGNHPIFMDGDDAGVEQCEVLHFKAGERILHGSQQRKGLYLVIDGLAEIYVESERNQRDEVLELVKPGGVFGFSSLYGYLVDGVESTLDVTVSVRASEDSNIVIIPLEVMKERFSSTKVKDYLFQQTTARLRDVYGSLAEQVALSEDYGDRETIVLRVHDVMSQALVTCPKDATIQEAGAIMATNRVSSVLVMDEEKLLGIATERDLVERVIAAGRSLTVKIQDVMTEQPFTISRDSYYYEALSALILKGVKHLPVMDGQQVCGMVALSDLLRKKNEGIMKTLNSIENADAEKLPAIKDAIYAVLETLLKEKVPCADLLDTITKLYDRLIARAVRLSVEDVRRITGWEPPCRFNLYTMGSSGRREQFILTDQDHFLVYEDHRASEYFKMLGKLIVKYMELAGYERCQGLMMSSEADWRGSVDEWERRVREWGTRSSEEDLLNAINFFSYRLVYGNEELHQRFDQAMGNIIKHHQMFLYRLAEVERGRPVVMLNQPILSMFRLGKKRIDMKKQILFPYHHGLQIFSMVHGIYSGTPFERLDALVRSGVLEESYASDMKEAMGFVLSLYVRQKWKEFKEGGELSSVLVIHTLSTWEREELFTSMKLLKELQSKVFFHFRMKI
ncbi:MAG: DUF294 nucleotidyltransferase-like domain-containing protein [Bacillus sp. (in: firmicutes)]